MSSTVLVVVRVERKPSPVVVLPFTDSVGRFTSTKSARTDLASETVCRSVVPVPENVALPAPVKRRSEPMVLLLLRSSVPLLVTLPATCSEYAVVAEVSSEPVAATVSEAAVAATSSVTVAPATMVTSSAAVGTTPPTQVAGALQLPPVAVEPMAASALWAATARASGAAAGAPTSGRTTRSTACGSGSARFWAEAPPAMENRPNAAATSGRQRRLATCRHCPVSGEGNAFLISKWCCMKQNVNGGKMRKSRRNRPAQRRKSSPAKHSKPLVGTRSVHQILRQCATMDFLSRQRERDGKYALFSSVIVGRPLSLTTAPWRPSSS